MITRFFFITIRNGQIILGPLALFKLLDSRKYVALVILPFVLVLPLGLSLTKPDRINSDMLLWSGGLVEYLYASFLAGPDMTVNLWTILLASGLTVTVTGLGALPFLFVKSFSRWWLSIFQAAAAGLMLGACFNLIQEGAHLNPYRTFFGIFLGLGLIVTADYLINRRTKVDLGELEGADARKALLILGIMTAHSFAEGSHVYIVVQERAGKSCSLEGSVWGFLISDWWGC